MFPSATIHARSAIHAKKSLRLRRLFFAVFLISDKNRRSCRSNRDKYAEVFHRLA